MATITAAAGGGDWNTGASWVGGVAPTAADDAQIPATAGNMSIGAGAVCRSADFSTYTGTLSGTGTLTIGDATAGLTNIALKLVAGMTVSGPPLFTFISTSATQQTVDFAGKTTGDVNFNGTNGSWQMTGGHTTAGTVTFSKTTLDVNGQTCSWGKFLATSGVSKTLTFGAANITITGTNAIVWDMTSTTFSGASSTITCNGNGPITFQNGSTFTYGTVNLTGNGTVTTNGGTITFTNFNRTGTAVKGDGLIINTNITVTGVLTLAGNSTINRLIVNSPTLGTATTITNSGATMTVSNTDFMDITLGTTWNASARTDIGDCGGNSGITFPASATQTWSGTSGGNWSANAWTSRVPLPQDDVVIASAFSASQTVTNDMPRLGRSIDWTGVSGTPTWSFGSLANSIYGSVTLASSMTISGANKTTLRGRSSFTLTSIGKSYTQDIDIRAPSGTYTLGDKLNSGAANLILTNGGFDASTFDVTIKSFNSSNSNTRTLTMGTGLWTLAETGALTIWSLATTTNLTFNAGTSVINYANATANTRTFAGGGLTYGTLRYNVAGSTGQLTITGANTFDIIIFSDITNARTIVFPASTTTTIITTFNVNGTSGKLMTINSSSAGTAATLSKTSGTISCDFLSIKDSTATGGASWYAGANSTNVSGNTGWIFTASPIPNKIIQIRQSVNRAATY